MTVYHHQPTLLHSGFQHLRILRQQPQAKRLVLTTVNAITQRVVPKSMVQGATFRAARASVCRVMPCKPSSLTMVIARTGTVVDPGDFAVRGGLIDIFPPGADLPVRLDFFGDTLESIRSFDPHTQRTTEQLKSFTLNAANEVLLDKDAVAMFRKSLRGSLWRHGYI